MNPEELLTRDALTKPHRTVIDRSQVEQSQIRQLTMALKHQMIKEIRESENEKSINSCLGVGSPGEFRTVAKHNLSIFSRALENGEETCNFLVL